MSWQPIETAPKDRWIVGYWRLAFTPFGAETGCVEDFYDVCRWNDARQAWAGNDRIHGFRPTHWMPLPDPPKV
jgi:hypothetical protein